MTEEIRSIVDYNFKISFDGNSLNKPVAFYSKCIGARELSYRLWNNFRWRGYIHPDVQYIIPSFKGVEEVKEDMMAQLMRANIKATQEPEKAKQMKKQFMFDIFSTLPRDLLGRIFEKYKTDIELFGYQDLQKKYLQNHHFSDWCRWPKKKY